jgi:hypothetical protein
MDSEYKPVWHIHKIESSNLECFSQHFAFMQLLQIAVFEYEGHRVRIFELFIITRGVKIEPEADMKCY